MPIQEIPITSWSNFKSTWLREIFAPSRPSRGRFYFRGQGSSAYPLVSSFDRWHTSSANIKKLSKKDATELFLKFFREEAGRLIPDQSLPIDQEQLLALAQHYGVPTRLLDWTESPYVAAFFAFSGIASAFKPPVQSVAIWCLDTESALWNQDTGIKYFSAPSPYNERLRTQLGKFTLLTSPFDSVEEHIDKCDTIGGTLRKIILPAAQARMALADLDFMGINYSTIYPGLDGCARAANLRMLLER
ncbi:MAG TPA: FRG domain-containing protein [Bryobacteraceae bacterium]|jgi:hypothetical protein